MAAAAVLGKRKRNDGDDGDDVPIPLRVPNDDMRQAVVSHALKTARPLLQQHGVIRPFQKSADSEAAVQTLFFGDGVHARWISANFSAEILRVCLTEAALSPSQLPMVEFFVEALMRHGCYPTLHYAMDYRNDVFTKALLNISVRTPKAVDVNLLDEEKWSPLARAVHQRNVPVVEALATLSSPAVLSDGMNQTLFAMVCHVPDNPLDNVNVSVRMASALLRQAHDDGSGLRLDINCTRANATVAEKAKEVLLSSARVQDDDDYRQLKIIIRDMEAVYRRQEAYRTSLRQVVAEALHVSGLQNFAHDISPLIASYLLWYTPPPPSSTHIS